MGAISATTSLPVLKYYLSDPERVVRETCEIAIAKIEWDSSTEGQNYLCSLNDSITPCANFLMLCGLQLTHNKDIHIH
jgi:deoxyhypusine monooxygenase